MSKSKMMLYDMMVVCIRRDPDSLIRYRYPDGKIMWRNSNGKRFEGKEAEELEKQFQEEIVQTIPEYLNGTELIT